VTPTAPRTALVDMLWTWYGPTICHRDVGGLPGEHLGAGSHSDPPGGLVDAAGDGKVGPPGPAAGGKDASVRHPGVAQTGSPNSAAGPCAPHPDPLAQSGRLASTTTGRWTGARGRRAPGAILAPRCPGPPRNDARDEDEAMDTEEENAEKKDPHPGRDGNKV
jgi:hypothetical protein